MIKKINKIAHSCNLRRIYFFKRCVKEAVIAPVFMFQLNLFQILGPRNDHLFLLNLFQCQYIQCHLRSSVIVSEVKNI